MIIALVGRLNGAAESPHSKLIGKYIIDLANLIIQRGHIVMFDGETATSYIKGTPLQELSLDILRVATLKYGIGQTADIAIVVGGDGTMLSALKAINGIPVMGVNLGRLGFITDVPFDLEHVKLIEMIEQKRYIVEKRTMLSLNGDLALNDVAITRSSGKILEFSLSIDGEFAYRARADGLLITTPTGSTAYAASAGGAIVHPTARVFEIVPMYPQTLSNRPLIVNDTSEISLTLIGGIADVLLDGNVHSTLSPGASITVTRSEFRAEIAHPSRASAAVYSYYHTLREKLNWQHLPGTIKNDDQTN